jgi:hypothetical protein
MAENGPEVTRFTHRMGQLKQLTRIGNRVYGIVDGGDLHPVGTSYYTDNGMAIQPKATTVNNTYGSQWGKRCQFAYFGTANDIRVSPVVDGLRHTPRDTSRGCGGERVARLPGGLNGTNWAFKIEAINGSQIRINHFRPVLEELSVGV